MLLLRITAGQVDIKTSRVVPGGCRDGSPGESGDLREAWWASNGKTDVWWAQLEAVKMHNHMLTRCLHILDTINYIGEFPDKMEKPGPGGPELLGLALRDCSCIEPNQVSTLVRSTMGPPVTKVPLPI